MSTMYAMMQNRIESFRDLALNSAYTKGAVARLNDAKERLTTLQDETASQVEQRRQALVASLQGRCGPALSVLRTRRDAAAAKVQAAAGPVTERVTAAAQTVKASVEGPIEKTVALARSTESTLRERLAERRAQLAAGKERFVTLAVVFLALVFVRMMAVSQALLSVLDARVPVAAAKREEALVAVRPYAARAVEAAAGVDEKLGAPGAAAVQRIKAEMERQAEEGAAKPEAAEETTAAAAAADEADKEVAALAAADEGEDEVVAEPAGDDEVEH